MNAWHSISATVRADFLQRARGYGVLIALGLTIFLTYTYLPPASSEYAMLSIGGYRGIYDSAWVGGVVAVMSVLFLAPAGFFVVKNTVTRDRETGVGQIIATTPLTGWQYTLGKTLSNFAFLAAIAAVAVLAGVAMQWLRNEDTALRPAAYLLPYALITLPMLAFVAGLAVLFESIGFLRAGFGNVLFLLLFFAWLTALTALDTSSPRYVVPTGTSSIARLEPTGSFVVLGGMAQAAKLQDPAVREGFALAGVSVSHFGGLKTFAWPGMAWPLPVVLGRLLWFVAALAIGAAAALFFDRFDTAGEPRRKRRPAGEPIAGQFTEPGRPSIGRFGTPAPASAGATAGAGESPPVGPAYTSVQSGEPVPPTRLTPLGGRTAGWIERTARTFTSELRLALRPIRWPWYAGAAALLFLSIVADVDLTRRIWLPLVWLWPVLVWSPLGSREVAANTAPVVFSAGHPLRRQLWLQWAAGAAIALVMAAPASVRLAIEGQASGIVPLVAGAAFVPALALALGTWSRSGKLFEVIYVVLWYVGPMNGLAALDFVGTTREGLSGGMAPFFTIAAAALLALAALGRQRQLYT